MRHNNIHPLIVVSAFAALLVILAIEGVSIARINHDFVAIQSPTSEMPETFRQLVFDRTK